MNCPAPSVALAMPSTSSKRERFVDLFDAQDTREGVNAFLEKREPQWQNK